MVEIPGRFCTDGGGGGVGLHRDDRAFGIVVHVRRAGVQFVGGMLWSRFVHRRVMRQYVVLVLGQRVFEQLAVLRRLDLRWHGPLRRSVRIDLPVFRAVLQQFAGLLWPGTVRWRNPQQHVVSPVGPLVLEQFAVLRVVAVQQQRHL